MCDGGQSIKKHDANRIEPCLTATRLLLAISLYLHTANLARSFLHKLILLTPGEVSGSAMDGLQLAMKRQVEAEESESRPALNCP